jgi:hypothetical protein
MEAGLCLILSESFQTKSGSVLKSMRITLNYRQCCGSGSGIRFLLDHWIRDPGWVKYRIRIRDGQPGSYFREFGNNFWA